MACVEALIWPNDDLSEWQKDAVANILKGKPVMVPTGLTRSTVVGSVIDTRVTPEGIVGILDIPSVPG